jgi:hypothetical protein
MTNQSELINEIAAALAKAQTEIKPAIKESNNPFFKSKYADFGSVVDACKSALVANDLVVTQPTTIINGQTALVTTLLHSSGQWVRGVYPVNPIKNDPQAIGSAITYARRYALASIVGVVAEEDDDGEMAMGRGQAQPVIKAKPAPKIELEQPVETHTTEGNSEKSPVNGSGSGQDWRGVVIHFGKNKGTALGNLPPKSLDWWIREWNPQPFKGKIDDASQKLRDALDTAANDVADINETEVF